MRKRRAIVFDDDQVLLSLFTEFFSLIGYEVFAYAAPLLCPVAGENASACTRAYPCADVLIVDNQLLGMNGLDLLCAQSRHGCKLTNRNKALMAGFIDEEAQKIVDQMGYAFFKKPLDLKVLSDWVRECEKRTDLSHPLGSRRLETRHATCHAIRCLVERTDKIINGMTVDMSDSGLRIKLADPLMPRQKVYLDTELPVIACHAASVRWVQRHRDGSYLVGLLCH